MSHTWLHQGIQQRMPTQQSLEEKAQPLLDRCQLEYNRELIKPFDIITAGAFGNQRNISQTVLYWSHMTTM